jgi:hypothetical protein
LSFFAALQQAFRGDVDVSLWDTANKAVWKHINIAPGEWRKTDLKVGLVNEGDWIVDPGFDWTQIKKVRVDCWFSGVGSGYFWIDALYFGGRRYAAVREDTASQNAYGLRELTETDEELVSDNECDLRAKALLDYFKNPAEYLTVRSTVIDYGLTPSLPADKIHVHLPNENVDSDFRIESVEYNVDAKVQTLEVIYELGKIPPQLADYLYGLRATTVTVEKLARTKLGKRGIPSVNYGGGMGAHHTGHETGDETGTQWPSEDEGGWDKINGWITPAYLGPYADAAAIVKFRTRNKAGNTPLDHQFVPSVDGYGIFGSESFRWKEIHVVDLFGETLNVADYLVITSSRVLQNVTASAAIITSGNFPLARLPQGDYRKFLMGKGVGYETAFDLVYWSDIQDKPSTYPPSSHYEHPGINVGGWDIITEGRVLRHITNLETDLVPVTDDTLALGTDSNRIYRVRAHNIVPGDLTFENDFTLTEAEKFGFPKGLAFLNPKGKILMLLDSAGNVEIFGKMKQQSSRLKRFWQKMKRRFDFAR